MFTLIQKFKGDEKGSFPVLSERDDIIVITDEVHRSQYDSLAMNMRNAMPDASFLAFMGMPLLAGEGTATVKLTGSFNRWKYTCSCGTSVWGKPKLKIICGDCNELFVSADAT